MRALAAHASETRARRERDAATHDAARAIGVDTNRDRIDVLEAQLESFAARSLRAYSYKAESSAFCLTTIATSDGCKPSPRCAAARLTRGTSQSRFGVLSCETRGRRRRAPHAPTCRLHGGEWMSCEGMVQMRSSTTHTASEPDARALRLYTRHPMRVKQQACKQHIIPSMR